MGWGASTAPAGFLAFLPEGCDVQARVADAIEAVAHAIPFGKDLSYARSAAERKAEEMFGAEPRYGVFHFDWKRFPGWKDFRGNPGSGILFSLCDRGVDRHFAWADRLAVAGVFPYKWAPGFPQDGQELALYDAFVAVLEKLDPDFGVIDAFGPQLYAKRMEGVDLRTKGWGLAWYGKELAGEIGVDRIRAFDAPAVEPRGDAWIVQAAQRPFKPTAAERRAAVQALDLKRDWGEPKPANLGHVTG